MHLKYLYGCHWIILQYLISYSYKEMLVSHMLVLAYQHMAFNAVWLKSSGKSVFFF